MKKKKGFTLIEVLIITIILSVVITGIIALISKYLDHGKEVYDNKLEESLLLAGKYYYTKDKTKLPKNGESVVVTLAELRNWNLVNQDFIDAYGNKCSNEQSLVMVTNNNGKYNYTACLYCENSDKFSDAHVEMCDPRNLPTPPEDDEPPKETPVCKIIKENDNYIVYEKDGKFSNFSNGFEAIKKLGETCDIPRNRCQTNEYKLEDGSKITYYYGSNLDGSNSKLYLNEEEAHKDGICKQICVSYKLQDGYESGIGTEYTKNVSTTNEITKNSQLSTIFENSNSIDKFEKGTSYYLHYVKTKAYNEILKVNSTSSSKVEVTNGRTSTLSEYFNPSKKVKVINSTNAKINYNKSIPDEYTLVLSKSSATSTITIPEKLKMAQKDINKWGEEYSKYAKYGRVVLAENGAKGNYKARYNNVGTYNGTKVDVVLTLTDFNGCKLRKNTSKCGIWFEQTTIAVYSLGVKRINIKYEFFEAGTDTPIEIKGYSTYWDIDANQGIHFIKGTTGIYAYGNNKLHISSLNNAPYIFDYNDEKYAGFDERGAITETFSGSVLNKVFTFMSGNDGDHSKITSSHGGIETSSIPMGVSKEYVGNIDSASVLKKDQIVKFIIRYSNMSSSDQTLTISDILTGMTYQKGTAKFSDGKTTDPTIKGETITWNKKVSKFSSGYVTFEVKVNSCGDITQSYATLKVGKTNFKSRILKNIAVCSKQVNTTCSEYQTS